MFYPFLQLYSHKGITILVIADMFHFFQFQAHFWIWEGP